MSTEAQKACQSLLNWQQKFKVRASSELRRIEVFGCSAFSLMKAARARDLRQQIVIRVALNSPESFVMEGLEKYL